MVPHICSFQDAEDVVMSANFQPQGHRSSTSGPPHFQFKSHPEKVRNPVVSASTLVILMIETSEALELVDEILALDGVDPLLIRTNDHTAEMSIPSDYENSKVA